MNYIEVTKRYWNVFLGEAPPFVRKRIETLVKAGFLSYGGTTGMRTTYTVVGGAEEYQRGSDLLISASL